MDEAQTLDNRWRQGGGDAEGAGGGVGGGGGGGREGGGRGGSLYEKKTYAL